MSVLKNVENKIKLVTITCGLFLFGCNAYCQTDG